MDIKTVCLGLLSFGEASGYDIKKHFEASFDQFFPSGFASIYPALAALAAEGLAECRLVAQRGRPHRKVYSITRAGEEVLRKSLLSCEPSHRLRSEFLALLYFADLIPVERVRELLDTRLAEMQQTRARMRQTGCPGEPEWPPSVRFVQGFGIALLDAAIDYTQRNRHLLDEPRRAVPARNARGTRRRSRRAA